MMCQVVFSSSSIRARSLASVQHLVHASMANGKHAGVSAAVDDGPLPSLLSFEEEPSPLLFLAARIESTHDTNDFC